MTTPVRLQLSRKKGFDLQAHSRSVNGLPAQNVARPSWFGNPWSVRECAATFDETQNVARHHVVRWFREWVLLPNNHEMLDDMGAYGGTREQHARMHRHLPELRDKNVACWCDLCPAHKDGKPLGFICAACDPCHGDPLLELANGERADG